MADTTKFLDYAGLKTYDEALKNYITGKLGTDYKIGSTQVNVKDYVDSRIFVGTAADVDLATAAGKIDQTTFTVVTDEDTDSMSSISVSDINNMFA